MFHSFKLLTIDSRCVYSRDIDDLIVGAPYDGDDHAGAVYIYVGSKEGLIKKPAQRISASNIGSNIRTFGYSISAGVDLDKNLYPDLVRKRFINNQSILVISVRVDLVVGEALYGDIGL